ncbi:hypothetical protein I532_16373 [Brevibacillus borstelensis AK1]|uniref:ATP-grasp domain-containing protein n=1 Tax=Brevibacillus borstelensis AK1 TaxID=1300222 RepID=M8DDQ6_9BACL|nr:hypothetical protein [Brevibacillus borstelensis]EMT51517.1 hypothetical protein I532_16373 [Brevibacillus borstelensis AK1]
MKKLLLFVESNTTGTGMIALKKAQERGFSPVFLTSKPERYAGLAETGCRVLVCDTNSLDALRTTIKKELPADQIAGIMTTSEFYLVTVATLAEEYGLPGNPPEAMLVCRNKAQTRLRLAKANVAQPRFAIIRKAKEIPETVKAIGLPCVVKPTDDSGSNDVKLCSGFLLSGKEGTLQKVEGVEEVRSMPGIRNVTISARAGDRVYIPQNAYHRLGYVIASGGTYAQTEYRLKEAVDNIVFTVKEQVEASWR